MKLKRIFAFLAGALALTAAVGCVEEEMDGLRDLKLSSSYVTFPADGGAVTITLDAREVWAFNEIDTTVQKWLSVSPLEGVNGETTVTFTATAAEDTREAELSIACGGKNKTIKVLQQTEKKEVPVSSCEDIIAGADGKTFRAKGICTKIANTQYGNWYLNDETGEVYIYGTVDGTGAYNWSSFGIEVGDEVTVEGPKTTYNGTVELVDVIVIEVNKSLIKVDSLSVKEALPLEGGELKAYLTNKGDGCSVVIPDDAKEWISITGIETTGNNTVVTFDIAANALGDRTTTLVFKTKKGSKDYTAQAEIKQLGAIIECSIADFLAAPVAETQYKLTGVITKVAKADYGNVYLKDWSGEAYIYGIGAKGDFATLGLKVGDIVTVQGKRSAYNDSPQMGGGQYISHISVTTKTIPEFLAAENSKDVYYMVSGVLKEIVKAEYGNVYITDGENDLYVYGVYPGYGATGDARKNYLATAGIEVGDTLTMIGYKDTYNDVIELCGGITFSFAKGEGGDEPELKTFTTIGALNADVMALSYDASIDCILDLAEFAEVTYINGSNVFIQDNTGGLLFYSTGLEQAIQPYQRIKAKVTLTVTNYNGISEVTAIKDGIDSAVMDWNGTYPCTNLTIAELLADYDKYVSRKIKIVGVKVDDGWQGTKSDNSNDRNGVISQGDNKINVYVKVKTDTYAVETGCEGDIVCWPTYNKETKQVGFWPALEEGKTFFTVTKEAGEGGGEEEEVYTTCKALNAAIVAGKTSLVFDPANNLEVTYVNGKNILAEDGTAGVLLYGTEGLSAYVGFSFKAKMKVTATSFHNLPEITGIELLGTPVTGSATYPCKNLTIEQLLADYDSYINRKVKIAGVKVTDAFNATDRDGIVAQGENTLAVRVQDTAITEDIKVGTEGDIVGWPIVYDANKQIGFWAHKESGKTYFTVTKEPEGEGGGEETGITTVAELVEAIKADAITDKTKAKSYDVNLADFAEITLVSGNNVFFQDATAGILIFNETIAKSGVYGGLRFKGTLTCKAYMYNGIAEIIDGDLSKITKDYSAQYPCKNLTIAELLADYDKYVSKKVKISGVEFTAGMSSSARSGEISQGSDKIATYMQNTAMAAVLTGTKCDVICWPTYYNTTKQVGLWADSGIANTTFIPGSLTMTKTLSLEVGGEDAVIEWTSNSEAEVTFESSDANVATVAANGTVHPVAEGTATITGTLAAGGKYGSTTATCVVTVSAAGAAKENIYYTLQVPKNTSNTAYASVYNVAIDGVTWSVPGNQSLDSGLKLGGKLETETERAIYSKGTLPNNTTKVVVTHGVKDSQITVKSMTLSIYSTAADAAAGTNALAVLNGDFVDDGETVFVKTVDADVSNLYYRLSYKMTSTAPSTNKGIIFKKAEFYSR